MANRLKEKIKRGEPVVGTVAQLGGGTSIECLGLAGLDFVVFSFCPPLSALANQEPLTASRRVPTACLPPALLPGYSRLCTG